MLAKLIKLVSINVGLRNYSARKLIIFFLMLVLQLLVLGKVGRSRIIHFWFSS